MIRQFCHSRGRSLARAALGIFTLSYGAGCGGADPGEVTDDVSAASSAVLVGLLPTSVVPPVNGSDETGLCTVTVLTAPARLSIRCAHDVEGVTTAHLHRVASGSTGQILMTVQQAASPFTATYTMTTRDQTDLSRGNLYIDIHSTSKPLGALRGPIILAPPQPIGLRSYV